MTQPRIPFNIPTFVGKEPDYIQQAIQNRHLSGDGAFTRQCHALLEQMLGAPKVLLTTSCTHALELSALLLDIQPGDEVIVPAFTFVTGINAFVLRGAKPVFADIRPDTLNLDESRLESLITPRTRAIVPVHYAGIGCEMDTIVDIAQRHNVTIIEDNAHALFGKYKGRYLGTFGALATQSFHDTKNFTCGEGGALVINDPQYIERAEIIREKGTNRSRFFRGQVDKYTWVDIGSSYLPSDILAAYLFAQLEVRDEIQQKRKRVWDYYQQHVPEWAAHHEEVEVPTVPEVCEPAYHLYYVLMPSVEKRQSMIEHLNAHGIKSVFHYLPLNASHMGQEFGGKAGDCPVTEDVSERLLRLPFYTDMTEEEQEIVIAALYAFEDW